MQNVTIDEMRELEARADREYGLTSSILMGKAGKSAAVVRDPQRHARCVEGRDHPGAFSIVHRHRFFDQARLAGGGDLQGDLEMRRRWGRNVHGVHIWITNEIRDAAVRARHCVAARVDPVGPSDG